MINEAIMSGWGELVMSAICVIDTVSMPVVVSHLKPRRVKTMRKAMAHIGISQQTTIVDEGSSIRRRRQHHDQKHSSLNDMMCNLWMTMVHKL